VVRWTIGDVSAYGFEALRLSIWGAHRIFGDDARYVVCVNTVPLEVAQGLCGFVPAAVRFVDCSERMDPFMRKWFDARCADGVGWKFAPLQLAPSSYELALDNDCVLWDVPEAVARWLDDPAQRRMVIAADVKACFGRFAGLCGPEPRNSGIRGLPPGFDLEAAFRSVLTDAPGLLENEQDEQGLQVAALLRAGPVEVVTVEEVAICSPFPPHQPGLGRCGVHFVGLNAKRLPFRVDDRPAEELVREHFRRLRDEVAARVEAPEPELARAGE
jgi:hypothetical protein